jgi:hypothetical protein
MGCGFATDGHLLRRRRDKSGNLTYAYGLSSHIKQPRRLSVSNPGKYLAQAVLTRHLAIAQEAMIQDYEL